MTKTTTRRALVAGAASLPALAVPAGASHDDAQLLAIEPVVKKLWNAYGTACGRGAKAEAKAGDAFHAAFDRALAMPATTAEGYRCKARIAILTDDLEIAWKLVTEMAAETAR